MLNHSTNLNILKKMSSAHEYNCKFVLEMPGLFVSCVSLHFSVTLSLKLQSSIENRIFTDPFRI